MPKKSTANLIYSRLLRLNKKTQECRTRDTWQTPLDMLHVYSGNKQHFFGGDDYIMFRCSGCSGTATFVKINLVSPKSYDIEFFKVVGKSGRYMEIVRNIVLDQILLMIIERIGDSFTKKEYLS